MLEMLQRNILFPIKLLDKRGTLTPPLFHAQGRLLTLQILSSKRPLQATGFRTWLVSSFLSLSRELFFFFYPFKGCQKAKVLPDELISAMCLR